MLHKGTEPVEYRVITPPDWDESKSLPLLLVLHGADSSAAILDSQVAVYEELWSAGKFPEAVVACASAPTIGGFYIGQWETLIAEDFPRELAERFNVDLGNIMLLGASMGGYGALKIAFAAPERFAAVAVLSPVVFPGETLADVSPRNTPGVLKDLLDAMAPDYAREHVVARLRSNLGAVRYGGLAIRIDCGDRDAFNLHEGAEYLHRVLWNLGVSHEYHLIQGADHVGPETEAREQRAREFLAAAFARRKAKQ